MRSTFDKLPGLLANGLHPVYLISGDEPLQQQGAADAVRAAARDAGYLTRELLEVDARFDWSSLAAASNSQSLFAERRIIELRVPNGKPGKPGGDALRAYLERPPEDTLLLIVAGKVDASGQKSAWYKAIDAAGVCVAVWPPRQHELAKWVAQRMRMHGLKADRQAAQLVAERTEGNLLAADQEIRKLVLILSGPRRFASENCRRRCAATRGCSGSAFCSVAPPLMCGSSVRGETPGRHCSTSHSRLRAVRRPCAPIRSPEPLFRTGSTPQSAPTERLAPRRHAQHGARAAHRGALPGRAHRCRLSSR